MRALAAIVLKDLLTELRLRQVLPTMFVLGLVLVSVFGLMAEPATRGSTAMTSAILWLAFAFAGLLAVERAFASEKESDCLALLLVAPVSRQTIFLAKCLSSAVLLLVVQVFTVPVAIFFFEYTLAGPPLPMLAVLVLGDVALATIGTLTSAMVTSARARGPLLSVLALPLLIPVLLVAAACTSSLVAEGWGEHAVRLMGVLALFDVVFLVAAWLLFPHVVES